MNSRLEVRHLQVIEAVHRLGSVTGAARSLNLTQPAVSHALREIERRLGAQVVVPSGRGVTATAAGLRLARRARAILDELAEAEAEVRALSEGDEGRLRLTTECYTCYHWLPGALAELRRRITVMARWAVAPQIREGSLRAVPVTKEGLVRHWWAAFPRGPAKHPGVDDLVELCASAG